MADLKLVPKVRTAREIVAMALNLNDPARIDEQLENPKIRRLVVIVQDGELAAAEGWADFEALRKANGNLLMEPGFKTKHLFSK
jgi:hypothetical protein